jgi:hypothetical protein
MKHLLMSVFQICSNKSPWFKKVLGPRAYNYTGEQFQGHHCPLVNFEEMITIMTPLAKHNSEGQGPT